MELAVIFGLLVMLWYGSCACERRASARISNRQYDVALHQQISIGKTSKCMFYQMGIWWRNLVQVESWALSHLCTCTVYRDPLCVREVSAKITNTQYDPALHQQINSGETFCKLPKGILWRNRVQVESWILSHLCTCIVIQESFRATPSAADYISESTTFVLTVHSFFL